jgi:hypothetical protein
VVSISNGITVTLSAIIDDSSTGGSDIGGANYTIDQENWPGIPMEPSDGSFDSSFESSEISIDTSGWVDGTYELYVYCWDSLSNYNHSSPAFASIVIDSTPPVSILEPFSYYWFTGSPISINATVSDSGSSVDFVELWYRYSGDNTSWGSWTLFETDHLTPWNWQFDFPDMDGYYELYAIAFDNTSNLETKSDAEIICGYDATAPVADAGSYEHADAADPFQFNGNSSTDNFLITNYTWTFLDGDLQTLYGPDPWYVFKIQAQPNFTISEEYNITLTVRDIAGNSDSDSVTIFVYERPLLGKIFGQVTDEDGNPIPVAVVKVVYGNSFYVAHTNTTGYYSNGGLPLRSYEIIAEASYYETQRITDFKFSEEKLEVRMDFTMEKIPEEESPVCLILYVMAAVFLAIFFLIVYLYIRKINSNKDGITDEEENGDLNGDQANSDDINGPKGPPSSPPQEN